MNIAHLKATRQPQLKKMTRGFRRVYHMSSAAHAKSNIRNHRLKIATFDDLNDPFEWLSIVRLNAFLHDAIIRTKAEVGKNHGLLCFSSDWTNPVLWSHYADKHRGICLGFDVATVDGNGLPYLIPVQYKHKMLPWPNRAFEEGDMVALMRTKFRHWAYEGEYRVFTTLKDPSEEGLYFCEFSDVLVLKEIILGPHCQESVQELTDEIVKDYSDVTVRKARLSYEKFKVCDSPA